VTAAFLGGGIGYRRAHHDALLSAAPADRPGVLEIMPDHFFADPARLAPLAAGYPLVFHDVGLSLGTAPGGAGRERAARLARIRSLALEARPVLFTDHLAMTRSPSGIDLGHLCPIPYTREALAVVAGTVRAVEDALGVPVALENIAAPFVLGGEMSEPEFFARLVDETGCGVLLDVTNLLYNARNQAKDPVPLLLEYPLDAVVQVHVAGGVEEGGRWVDSHSEPVDEGSLALLAALGGRAPRLRAVIVERDSKLPPLARLVDESRRAASALGARG
jgi:uncharacterized protein